MVVTGSLAGYHWFWRAQPRGTDMRLCHGDAQTIARRIDYADHQMIAEFQLKPMELI